LTQGDADLPRNLIGDILPLSGVERENVADAGFAELLKQRVANAWDILYERHFDRIYRYALARLGDEVLAEDAAATTFQRALSAIDRYSHRGSPLVAWLYGIARNVVREQQRSLQKGKLLESFIRNRRTRNTAGRSVEISVGDTADASIRSLDLAGSLGRLTEAQREVIILRYFSGLSGAEAALVMKRPEAAVYALQARALAALRRRLA
jgi:RNA polymerase sigma-70 factor (ECF subfamily)